MENHFVRKLPRFFSSSFTSCQFRNVPDIVDNSIFITKNTQIVQQNEAQPCSKIHSNPSLSKPQRSKTIKNDSNLYKRNKNLHFGSDTEGKRCPPVTPVSNLKTEQKQSVKGLKTEQKQRAKGLKIKNSSSSNSGWFSSEDNGESNTFFSLSSVSSESFRMKTVEKVQKENKPKEVFDEIPAECYDYYRNSSRKTSKTCRKSGKNRRRIKRVVNDEAGSCPIVVDGRFEESYAVEKTSSDPYSDFRISMVEMIIEKNIFGDEDLEKLLNCFLSLNSPHYHNVILEVFMEICETLFTN